MEKDKIIVKGIYKVTCLTTEKNYIGQSTDIERRLDSYQKGRCTGQPTLQNSFLDYGIKNHTFEIIEEINETDEELFKNKMNERELYWTHFYKALVDEGGLVVRAGGRHGHMALEVRKIMSEKKTGDKHFYKKNPRKQSSTDKQIESIIKIKDPVNVYTLEGVFIKQFAHPSNARSGLNIKCTTGDIIKTCERKQLKCKGYIFQFDNDDKIQEVVEKLKTEIYRNNIKKIYQYDLQNNYIKEWNSSYEIEKDTPGIRGTDVRACCKGNQKTAYGFKWSYEKNIKILDLPSGPVDYRQFIISKDFFLSKSPETLLTYVDPLWEWLHKHQPTFPFDKIKYGEKNPTTIINYLRKYDSSNIIDDKNKTINNSTSSEGVFFLKSRFLSFWKSGYSSKASPYSMWDDEKIFKNIIKYRIGYNKVRETFEFSLHQMIRGISAIRGSISFFKPTVSSAIYKHFLKDHPNPIVLDPCAGFGGRLLGFKSIYPDGTYIGVEPNTETYNELKQLAEECKFTNVILHNCKIEEYKGDIKHDLAFTSIPYYDAETYSINIVKTDYTDLNDWVDKFINKAILKIDNLVVNVPPQLVKYFPNPKDQYVFKNHVAKHLNKSDITKNEMVLVM